MGLQKINKQTKDIVEKHIDRVLRKEPTGVFSKQEVTKKAKKRIRWKGSGDSEKLAEMHRSGEISRRKFLKMLGLGAGGAFVASSGIGYVMGTKIFDQGRQGGAITGMQTGGDPFPEAPGSNVIRANSLDEALDSLGSGNKVILAEGEYDHQDIDITAGNTALIGDGEVKLNLSGSFAGRLANDSGTSLLKNITIEGTADTSKKAGMDIDGDGTQIFDNVNMPDGTVDGAEGRAIYERPEHEGTGYIRNGYFAGFASDCLYTDKGEIHVNGCMVRNNNISMIRLGGDNSSARNCVVMVDGPIKSCETGSGCYSARGIRVRQPGSNITIENCHCTYTADPYGGAPIELHDEAKGSTGVIRNVRILNDTGIEAINDKGVGIENWEGEDICVKGDGNLETPFSSSVQTGSSCPDPKTEPIGGGAPPEGGYSGGGGEGSGPTTSPLDMPTNTLEISSSGSATYVFSANGPIEENKINSKDQIFANKAVGKLEEETDIYTINGEITEFHAAGDVNIIYKGSPMDVSDLKNICNRNRA